MLGRVSYDVDGLKGVTAYAYDGLGQVTRTVRYANALTLAVPAAGYYLGTDITATALIPDATLDRTLITRYDALGRKASVQKDDVSLFTFTGNVATSTLTNLAPTTLYSYDAFGQLVRETQVARNASGATAQTGASSVYYYDVSGNRIGSVDALGYYTRMEYDALGQLTRQTEYATKLTSWNTNDLPAAPTASVNDRSTRFAYDAMSRLSQTTLEGARFWQQSINATTGAVSATLVTADLLLSRSTYDGVGNVKTVTDAKGNVVSTDYNALGQVIKVTEPARATGKNGAVDPFASAEVIASPTTTLLLNAFGQQIREVRAVGTDSAGNVQAGLGQITRTRYDAAGHEILEIDAAGSVQNYKVDVAGRRIEESRKVSATLSAWTANGAAVSYNQTLKRTFQYDALGQQTATIDWYIAANGTAQSTSDSVIFNRFGEVTRKLLNGNTVEIFNYDQVGRLESHGSATDVTSFQYDLSEKVSKSTALGDWSTAADDRINYMRNDLLGRTYEQHLPAFEANLNADTLNSVALTLSTPIIRQTVDRWGNVLSRTDARGYVTIYTYDHYNKQLTETLPVTDILRENGTSYRANLIHEKRYDALGQLIQEVDLVGPYTGVATSTLLRTRQHVYNQAGQLTRDIDALGYSRDYRVDANGNRIATRDALGIVTVDGYDAMDRHINHGIIRSGAKVTLLTNLYDQAGRLYGEISGASAVEETLQSVANTGNWTSTITGVAGNTKYSLFDERGNIVKTRNESKIERTVEYDVHNRKVKETDGLNGTLTWTYDIASLGRLSSRKDLAGRVYSFTYNGFGQLIKETLTTASGAGPDKTYSHYANGLTKTIVEGTVTKDAAGAVTAEDSRTSTYAYDLSGNRIREINSGRYLKGAVSQASSNEVRSRFDEQGRLEEVKAPAGNQLMGGLGTQYTVATTARLDSLKYDYDEVGNRRRVYMDTTNQSGGRTTKDDWYKYDLEGRALIAEGYRNAGGQIVAGSVGTGINITTVSAKGYALTYNAIGQRISSESWKGFIEYTNKDAAMTAPIGDLYEVETYSYNDLGQLGSTVGRAVGRKFGSGGKRTDTLQLSVNPRDITTQYPVSEVLQVKYSKTYDERGNLMSQKNHLYKLAYRLTAESTTRYAYSGDGQLTSQFTYDSAQRLTQANYFNESGMLDAAGNQRAYRYVSYNANGSINHRGNFSAGQVLFDGYKESQSTMTRTNGGSPGTTTYTYSARGELLQTVGTGGNVFTRRLATNDEGRLITRQESSGNAQTYLYYQGAALANIGNASAPEISDTFTPISTDYPERTPSNYVVNQGDTLESIAQSVWGDSKMWYLIADANGLDPSKPLNPGDNLKIPNVVSSTHNDATTFKPYSPDDVIGNTTPTPIAPPPPKPKKKKSGGLASVVMVVVAVVATVLTAGAALVAMGAAAGYTTVGAGIAALSGGIGGWAGLGAAFIGGMAGSAAAQLAGNAMGVTDGFSWGQVAMGGLGAAVGAGVGGLVSGGQTAQQLAQTGSYGKIATAAVLNSFGNYGASKIVGLDTSFSWRSIATSALASVATARISQGLGLTTDNFKSNFINGVIGAQVSSSAQALIGKGGKLDYAEVAADAFGNAIGNGLIEASLPEGNFFGPESGATSKRQEVVADAFERAARISYAENYDAALKEVADMDSRAERASKNLSDPAKLDELKAKGLDASALRKAYISDLAAHDSYLDYDSEDAIDKLEIESMKKNLGRFGVRRLDANEIRDAGLSPDDFVNKKSDFSAALYKDEIDGGYYLANRGTESAADAWTDAVNNFGYVDGQFKVAVSLAKDVYTAFKGNVTFVGHSLGGALASVQATSVGGQAITFNAAGVHPRVAAMLKLDLIPAKTNVTAYHVGGDLVSIAQDSVGYDIAAAVLGTLPVAGIEAGRLLLGNKSASNIGFAYAPEALGRRIELPSVQNGRPMSRSEQLNPLNQLQQHKNGSVLRSLEYLIGTSAR
ncbi:LysM peptidoglycan-binding domain-containing protein [Pseudomonas kilonensis]|uniref:LysM peptidoglycan-binding domain-containing protein n=1 Tax=Pseudomonas kilonensis TaxID=132476 RepID=UPI0004264542|nr:LysM peptidoglycan-binding domain-containing protein [Pseudomonas kilonensis]